MLPVRSSSSSTKAREVSYSAQIALPFTALKVPVGMAVDGDGDVYVTDSPTEFAGFDRSWRVAVDPDDKIYVADGINERVLKLEAHR